MSAPTPEELREARRQSLLQLHVNGKRLTSAETAEIEDLIADEEKEEKPGKEVKCKLEYLERITGLTGRWIQKLAEDGILPKAGRNQYPRDRALTALFANLREQTSNTSARTKAHAERTAAAEATSAEVRAAKDLGEACLAKEIEAQWEDVATKVRVIVETFPGLTEKQKDGLLEKLARVKLSETDQ